MNMLVRFFVCLTNVCVISLKPTVLVAGGAGRTGSEVVYQALKDGYDVVALTRDSHDQIEIPDGSGAVDGWARNTRITHMRERFEESGTLDVVKGSVTNQSDVDACFDNRHVETVFVALGGNTGDVGKDMLTHGTRNIIRAMKVHNCSQIVVITSAGAGNSYEQAPVFFRALMATLYADMFTDKNNQEALFDHGADGSSLPYWCVVRPGGLTDGPPTDVCRVTDGVVKSVSRANVARFCLDVVSQKKFCRQQVVISDFP